MLRRRFVNWLLGTTSGALLVSVLYPVLRFLSPPEVPESTTAQVDAGASSDPEFLDRGFKIIRFGNEPVMVLRVAENDFRAFSATCTHLDCIVEYQKEQNRIWCNCHNGEYNLRGVPVAGPPPKPLEAYQVDLVKQEGGQRTLIVVSRV